MASTTPSLRPEHRAGFSLVELLVVIGVVALLIALLLPALNRVREQAKAVQCSSQLKQLGVALFNYAERNRGYMPPWSNWHVAGGDGTGEDAPGPAWTEVLAEAKVYPGPLDRIYNCPGFPQDRIINYFIAARYSHSIGKNTFKIGQVKLSSKFVLSGDCTQASLYPFPFGLTGFTLDDADKDDATQEGVVFAGDGRRGINVHGTGPSSGNNVLFADGHVSFYRRFEKSEMTYHPTEMREFTQFPGLPNGPALRP